MPTQLLFYEAAVPLSANRHAHWSIEPRDYSFSRGINSLPLTAVEFAAAVGEYSIVFAGKPGAIMPTAILGMRSAENLYLTDKGGWDARYVPAFVRRYPFVFSSPDEGRNFTLCIDEGFAGFNQDGRGQPLFGADRKTSPYTDSVLKFLQQYQLEFQRTQAFCRKLEELQLLEPMQAQFSLDSGERMSLTGFMAVDRKQLKALPAEVVAQLVKADELELLYLHLQSMRNFARMRERVRPAAMVAAQAEAAAPAPIKTRAANTAKPAEAKARKKPEGKPYQ